MSFTKDQWLVLQTALNARYYALSTDGIPGPNTHREIANFLLERGLINEHKTVEMYSEQEVLDLVNRSKVWARGIDVSHWQDGDRSSVGDLKAAVQSGISFVLIKAGGADGGLYEDGEYEEYSDQATALDLTWGTYFFCHFAQGAVQQGQEYSKLLIKRKAIEKKRVRPFLDVEDYKTKIQGQACIDHVLTVADTVQKETGVEVGLYISGSVLKTHSADLRTSGLSKYPLWIPAYGVQNPGNRIPLCYGGIWRLWQPGYGLGIPGFKNATDRILFPGTREEFLASDLIIQ